MTEKNDEQAQSASEASSSADDHSRSGSDDSTATRDRLVRAGHVLGILLLIAAVVPFVVYAVPGAVGAEHSYVVLSGSMEPTLSPGDVILVDDVPASAIEEGDVITFTRNGEQRTTTHRVIGTVERDGGVAFRTQGDNNEDPDQGLVEPSQVQGEIMSVNGALLVVPYIGYVIRFAATQTGFALLALGPLALLVLSEIWNVVAATRSDAGGAGKGGGTGGESADEATDDASGDPVRAFADADAASGGAATREPDDGDGLTIRARELRLGVAILGAFVAYSVVVAYVTTEPWAIGAAAAVVAAFGLLAGLYFFGGGGDAPERAGGDGGGSRAAAAAGSSAPPVDDAVENGMTGDGEEEGTAPGGAPAPTDGGTPAAEAPDAADDPSGDRETEDAAADGEEDDASDAGGFQFRPPPGTAGGGTGTDDRTGGTTDD